MDAVILHGRARKALDWAGLSADWPTIESLPGALPTVAEAHRSYVERFDSFRNPDRAERLIAANRAVAERVATGEPLSWPGLCAVQAIALGVESVGFRQEPAFARARMQRFGCHPRYEEALAKQLAKSDPALHPLARACRTLLDLRFFHAFAEGNSGAAQLAFLWIAESAGLRLADLTPILRLPMEPGSVEHYTALMTAAGQTLKDAAEGSAEA